MVMLPARRPLTRFERLNVLLQTLREELGIAVEEVSTANHAPVLKLLEMTETMIANTKFAARRQMIEDALR